MLTVEAAIPKSASMSGGWLVGEMEARSGASFTRPHTAGDGSSARCPTLVREQAAPQKAESKHAKSRTKSAERMLAAWVRRSCRSLYETEEK